MRPAALFGLLALVPASLNAAVPASRAILAPTCAGAPRAITVPLRPGAPREESQPCCAKGCHTGSSRKRFACDC